MQSLMLALSRLRTNFKNKYNADLCRFHLGPIHLIHLSEEIKQSLPAKMHPRALKPPDLIGGRLYGSLIELDPNLHLGNPYAMGDDLFFNSSLRRVEIYWPKVCEIPTGVAICPKCDAPLVVEEVADWEGEFGLPIESGIHITCATRPDIEHDNFEFNEWHSWHYAAPYIDWLPIEEQVLSWIRESFRKD